MAKTDRDYVLGTHDEEVERLGLQHRVWRPRSLDGWRRGGFNRGQTLVDVGSGPGYATTDLAEIVGPEGRVVALERSSRFLETAKTRAERLGLRNIETVEIDLDQDALPAIEADGAWVRWVFAFVKRPRALIAGVRDILLPGGVLVIHEYFDYATWRLAPRSSDFEELVSVVMKSWRATGGEPDIGLELPCWLEEMNFEIRELRPIVDVITPSSFIWQWPRSFVEVGLERLAATGQVSNEDATRILRSFRESETAPHTWMVTPSVLEIIAVKR